MIAWFVVIFGINTTSDISKLLGEWNLRQFWNITSAIYAKYDLQIMVLIVYTTTCRRFVIFACRYFKLSWNTTALSQSNYRNFSWSSINLFIQFKWNIIWLRIPTGRRWTSWLFIALLRTFGLQVQFSNCSATLRLLCKWLIKLAGQTVI